MSPAVTKPDDATTTTDSARGQVVIPFSRPASRPQPIEPLFTDAERIALRAMLRQFEAIKKACPMARRLTQEE